MTNSLQVRRVALLQLWIVLCRRRPYEDCTLSSKSFAGCLATSTT